MSHNSARDLNLNKAEEMLTKVCKLLKITHA